MQSGDFEWDKETEVEVLGENVKIAVKKN